MKIIDNFEIDIEEKIDYDLNKLESEIAMEQVDYEIKKKKRERLNRMKRNMKLYAKSLEELSWIILNI